MNNQSVYWKSKSVWNIRVMCVCQCCVLCVFKICSRLFSGAILLPCLPVPAHSFSHIVILIRDRIVRRETSLLTRNRVTQCWMAAHQILLQSIAVTWYWYEICVTFPQKTLLYITKSYSFYSLNNIQANYKCSSVRHRTFQLSFYA